MTFFNLFEYYQKYEKRKRQYETMGSWWSTKVLINCMIVIYFRYRDSWEKYCSSSDCIIFILDASDKNQIDVARTMLHD